MSTLSVPLKTVLSWYADLTTGTTPPAGWEICDGRTLNTSQQDIVGSSWTLPDLRNRFIIGATLAKGDGVAGDAVTSSNIDAAAGAPGPKGVGGSNKMTIGIANLPMDNVTGSGQAIDQLDNTAMTPMSTENRPLYYGLVYIMKVKY